MKDYFIYESEWPLPLWEVIPKDSVRTCQALVKVLLHILTKIIVNLLEKPFHGMEKPRALTEVNSHTRMSHKH